MKKILIIWMTFFVYTSSLAQQTIYAKGLDKTIFLLPPHTETHQIQGASTVAAGIGKTLFLHPEEAAASMDSIVPPVLAFDNTAIAWQQVAENESRMAQADFEYNDLHRVSPLNSYIVGDKLISLYGVSLFWGTYITCHDIHTGDMLWQQAFSLDTQAYMESYASGYLLDENTLELVGTRHLITDEVPQIFGIWGKAIVRRIDIQTGETKAVLVGDISDPEQGVFMFGNTSAEPAPIGRADENHYMALQHYGVDTTETNSVRVGPVTFDANANEVSGTNGQNYFYSIGGAASGYTFMSDFEIINGQYVVALFTRPAAIEETTYTRNQLLFADKSGDPATARLVDFTEEVGIAHDGNMWVNEDRITILADGFANNPNVVFDYDGVAGMVRLDTAGNILEAASPFIIDGYVVENGAMMCVMEDGQELYVFSEDGQPGTLYIYQYDGTTYSHLKTLQSTDQICRPTRVHYSEDMGLVLNVRATRVNEDGSNERVFDYVLGIVNEELGILTSTETLSSAEDALLLFPNPVYDKLSIVHKAYQKEDLSFGVYDGLGNRVKEVFVPSFQQNIVIDLSDLPAGTYFLKDDTATFTTRKIILMR